MARATRHDIIFHHIKIEHLLLYSSVPFEVGLFAPAGWSHDGPLTSTFWLFSPSVIIFCKLSLFRKLFYVYSVPLQNISFVDLQMIIFLIKR